MDVLVPDPGALGAPLVVEQLERAGHRVHHCSSESGACAAFEERSCPLDVAAVDVVVEIPGDVDELHDGVMCALRRRIPVVAPGPDAVEAVAAAVSKPMTGHTDAARKALLHELRRHGCPSSSAEVAVYRRPGRLLVDLRTTGMSRTQNELIAAYVAQAVRRHDRFAPKLDVTVHAHGDTAQAAAAG